MSPFILLLSIAVVLVMLIPVTAVLICIYGTIKVISSLIQNDLKTVFEYVPFPLCLIFIVAATLLFVK